MDPDDHQDWKGIAWANTKAAPETSAEELREWKSYAWRLVHEYVKLEVETENATQLATIISPSAAGKVRGDAAKKTYVGVLAD
eukprot:6228399-Alexandrium_andersonii.AAC.1